MMTDLKDFIDIGCAAIVADVDGVEKPCGGPVVAIRH